MPAAAGARGPDDPDSSDPIPVLEPSIPPVPEHGERHETTVPDTFRVSPRLQVGVLMLALVGALVWSAGEPGLLAQLEGTRTILSDARELTRTQEGLILSPYVPASTSGVTIGHGYDMGSKTPEQIARHLAALEPPVPEDVVQRLADAAGLTGGEAARFVSENADIALTAEQADALFDTTYAEEADLAVSFATNPTAYADLGVAYPAARWEGLDPAIQGIVIDLKFRGDYRPWWEAQSALQQAIVDNDAEAVLVELRRIEIFPDDLATIAPARFGARVAWMEQALESR